MLTVTHREMRNSSGDLLRRVAAGESIQISNAGRIAAVIVPFAADAVTMLTEFGAARTARRPVAALTDIRRRISPTPSAAIIADARGRW